MPIKMTLTKLESEIANWIEKAFVNLGPTTDITHKIVSIINLIHEINYQITSVRLRFLVTHVATQYMVKRNEKAAKLFNLELGYCMNSKTILINPHKDLSKIRIIPHNWNQLWGEKKLDLENINLKF